MNKLSYALITLGVVMFFLPVLAFSISGPATTNIINTIMVLIYYRNYVTVAQMLVGVIAIVVGVRMK